MEKEKTLLRYLKRHSYITVEDAAAIGISKSYLYKIVKSGTVINLQNGLFSLPESYNVTEFDSLIEISKRVPNGVISLLSALSVHQLTTHLPSEVWVTMPRNKWCPSIGYPPVRYTTAVKSVYSYGIQTVKIGNSSLKVYSPAKTVADCFKNRNKIGLDVAIEALRDAWRHKKVTMDELVDAAKICRVLKVMKPYLEAIV